jgi:transcriptional regulator
MRAKIAPAGVAAHHAMEASGDTTGAEGGSYRIEVGTDDVAPRAAAVGILLSVTDRTPMSKPTDLVQGTLDLLILRVLALEPMHGWAIAQRIRQMSAEELRVGQSALYPALHKLEQQSWIAAEWALSDNNRRAKFYRLTAAGRKALKVEAAQWERLSAAISLVVKPL